MIDKEKTLYGLTDEGVESSGKEFGINQLSRREPKSLWSMFVGSFGDIWIKVLCAALALKILLAILGFFVSELDGGNDFIEIFSILLAIMLATGFSTLSEYRNTARSEALQEEYNKTYAKVMRNGKLLSILTSQIVKGDTVLVQAGDKVPVDGVLFKGRISVSQAALNGESRDEDKVEADSYDEALSTDYQSVSKVFMGSVVTAGEGYMVATVIGDESELGKINKALNENEAERKDTSSLKLEKVAAGIGRLGMIAAVIASALQVILQIRNAGDDVTSAFVLMCVAEAVMLMASIIIMAVPEGLPMMNSLVQAMNTESMYKKHILVSHKAAFADSAYVNVLFSDKTGTITEGNLSLVEFILGDGNITDSLVTDEFLKAISINNLAKVSEGNAIGSNNMDRSLLSYALRNGFDEGKISFARQCVKVQNGFNSEKKCATVELDDGVMLWKGATENIVSSVSSYMTLQGEERPFGEVEMAKLEKAMVNQQKRTMKLLSVAKIVGGRTILLAVLCLRDNVRRDAVETVEVLNRAGIQVVMVTGDSEQTAVAIAREAGIYNEVAGDVVLTHDEMDGMDDEQLKKILSHLRVVSRAKPLDKKRLVRLSQELDNVCGMTGDGVNDAPALKAADVGFAMGDGTAVAQEAGDVVILNNSLTSIKDCILNSRTMAKSVGKFLIFQLTVNIATLLINILAPLFGWFEPFTIVQILWINLIMDTLAAMAFGGEPILFRYMNEPPARRSDNILTKYIKSAIFSSAVFITLGSFLILENVFGLTDFILPSDCIDPELYKRTFMFAFFIYSVIFNSLNTRSERFNLLEKINDNPRFVYVMGAVFLLQTLMIEFGGVVFGTTTLDVKALLVSMSLALLIIPFDLMRKVVFKKKPRI